MANVNKYTHRYNTTHTDTDRDRRQQENLKRGKQIANFWGPSLLLTSFCNRF